MSFSLVLEIYKNATEISNDMIDRKLTFNTHQIYLGISNSTPRKGYATNIVTLIWSTNDII